MKTFLPKYLIILLLALIPRLNYGQAPNLGSAASFAVFTAAGEFSNGGATQITGDVGTNVGAFTGFLPGIVVGSIHVVNTASAEAATDVATAYGELSSLDCGAMIGTTLGNGQVLTPNIYCLGAASTLDGELILDAQGDAGAIFIFKIDGALSTTTLSKITLINGASLCNVYFQVNGAVSLGGNSNSSGTVIAAGAISLAQGASLTGQALSTQGAISLNNNTITGSGPSESTIAGSSAITFCAGGSVVLSGNVGGTWSNGSSAESITVTTSGDYFVTNTAPCGSVTSNHIMVTVIPLPSCLITGDIAICAGQSTELCVAAGAASYLWSTGGTTNCITVSAAGTYSVTVTDGNGCQNTCNTTVVVNPLPSCLITGDVTICAGQSTQLCAAAGFASYLWSNGGTTNCISASVAGTYSVTVTDGNGCQGICSTTVVVNPLPSCLITGNLAICAGQSTQLCVAAGLASYLWSTGGTTNCISTSVAGTYSVTVTDGAGCQNICSATVVVNPLPSCLITGNVTICAGLSTQLCVAAGFASYLWSTGGTTNCISASVAGTYSVTVTNGAGCQSICSTTVVVNPLPSCLITGNVTICAGQSTQLCVAAGFASYLWSNGGTTNCISASVAGTYSVTVTDGTGCQSICSTTVVVNPLPSCLITGDIAICAGQSTQLCVAAGFASYLWSNGGTTNCISASVAGTYSVTVTDGAGCQSICSTTLVVSPLPTCLITGNVTICAGQSTQLCVAAGFASYLWSTGEMTNCISASVAGTYSVTVTDGTGCQSICSATVVVNPLPTCLITGNVSICSGLSTELCVAAGFASYLWSNGGTTNCITASVAGTYSVTVTDGAGCQSICSTTVVVNPLPSCLIIGQDAICAGLSTELCVLAGATSYLWSTGATTNCITVNAAGTYSVTVTGVGGCTSVCSKTITISQQPTCLISGNDAICVGSSTQLCVPAGALSYLWSTGATTNCITVNAVGTYSVTVTNTGGCISICSKIITISPPIICLITGDVSICTGQSTELCVAAGFASYLWSNGGTTNCITASAAGTYSVTVTDGAGCQSVCSTTVVVNPLPSCLITGDVTICVGLSTELCVAPGFASYLWSNGGTTNCITASVAGTYSVTVTDGAGCQSVCSTTLVVNPLPSCLITGEDAICAGQSTELCVPAGAMGYLWSTGATTNCITVNAAGTYSVTVTNAAGCTSVCSKIITINQQTTCLITGNDAICAGQSTELCVSAGAMGYLWSTGATTNCITVNAAGTYSVTVTNAAGCTSVCSKTITISQQGTCLITGNVGLCVGLSTDLCVPAGYASYLWSTGGTTNCITASVAGTYSVTVTDGSGCQSICSTIVVVNPLPSCLITGVDAICAGQSTELCVEAGAMSYLWSTGATTNCITVNAAGIYSVTVTNAAGCTSVCSKIIAISQQTTCLITGNDAICAGQSTQLCVPAGAISYLWSTGATTNCITVNAAGTYSVTVTDADGCISICSETVTISQQSTCLITGNDAICAGQSTQLCVPAGAMSYLWSTGATTNCITVNAAGTYSVTVTDAAGCTSVCSETVTISQQTTCLITGNDAICAGQSTQLCVPAGAMSYLWSTGATTNCITVNAAGTYSVTVTDAAGCSSVCSETVTISQQGSCLITGNNTTCLNQSTLLCAPAGALSYLWSTGATTNCIIVNAPGTYGVTVTDVGGCTSVCSKTISLNQQNTCLITGEDAICIGQSTQLCVPAGEASYLWSTGATTNCITVNATGTYRVTVTDEFGCTSVCSKTIRTSQESTCLISGYDQVCVGQSTELCVPTGALSYLWSTGATTNCITVNAAGTYSVTVTFEGGCISTCSKTIKLSAAVSCLISGNSFICEGRLAQLCAPALADAYLWSNGATTRCIHVSTPGTYSVTVTYVGGCVSTCSKTITLSEETACEITGNTVICEGQTTRLCAVGGAVDYWWSTGEQTQCINVTAPGTYSLTLTTSGGCVTYCSKTVTLSPATCDIITGNDAMCIGQSTELCVPTGALSYRWNTGATTNCITVNTAGTYSVTVTYAPGCTSICSKTVTIGRVDTCLITGNTNICPGQTTRLCVPLAGATDYWWITGAQTQCIDVTTAGTYSVTVTEANGCKSECSVIVTEGEADTCLITGNTTICPGQTTRLCVPLSGATDYWWITGAQTQCIDVTTAGLYSVTVTEANGCKSECSVVVTMGETDTCLITETVICPGQSTRLCVPLAGASDYWWITGAQTQCIDVTTAGLYSVTVTDANGCKSECSVIVTMGETDTCLITGNTNICPGQSTRLCVPLAGAIDYWWITGAQTQCIDVTTAGTYSVTVTDANGCKSECSVVVTEGEADTCLITGNTNICPGQTTRLCVPLSGATDYWWITGAQTQCIDVTTAGTYSVTVTEANGCKSECSVVVTMSEGATCLITGSDIIRPGQSTQLCVSSGALSYLWSTGATTNCITANAAGTYSVTVTYAGGCTSVCSKTIAMVSEVNCIITGNSSICPGRLAQLCAPALAEAYLWSTGDTTRCIHVSSAGTYAVTVTYVGGIVRTCSKTIGVNEDTTCEITGDTVLCPGKTTRLCAPEGAIDYWWSTGEQTRCINVTSPGTYALTLTTSGGCMSFCSKTVTRCPDTVNYTGRSIAKKVIQSDGNVEVRIYPNPLYAKTMIEFQNTLSDSHVLIEIFSSTGSKVATLYNGNVEKNVLYNTELNAESLAGGVYYCRIVHGRQTITRKLILLKN
ncbi:ice-binding family protein [Haliscomenobacter hydrossis]|uniref:PKD domain containing protein n=1 Tax=Haliscomenobacter hydrossis (strain ATCC 27775 / DSM 1100 / LMG 10767 / O) TaxID=760192 RepID=F4KUS6_HALH1|nr:ice-binding family protein [Haliscomenobacter hydrossis]AEE53479.1 PKD domain containing protein [Haliscomenobacter hydrossis DSM 1100]